MKKRDSRITDGDADFEWEEIKADEDPDGRDWDTALRDEYLVAAHGVATPEDVKIATTANEIEHARGTATPEDDEEIDEILRLAGMPRRRTASGPIE